MPAMSLATRAGALCIAATLAGAGPDPAAAEHLSVQEAVLRAKPAVALVVSEISAEVRVNCGGGGGETRVAPPPFRETGTGWVIDPNGFLITNAHVVQPAYSPQLWLINSLTRKGVESACVPIMLARLGVTPGERPDLEEEIKRRAFETALPTASARIEPAVFIVLSNGTRLRAQVRKYSPPVATGEMSGRDLALVKVEARDLPVLPLGVSRNAQIGDPVHILGFPGVVLSHELLNASAKAEASVTNGAISGFKQDVADNPVIQTDAPAAWGNSGGPAVNLHAEVIGVLTFVSLAPGPEGGIVQGFNFIIPADAVREFVKGTEVKLDGRSRFNDEWWAGLRDFFGEKYRRAARRFEAADKIQPNFPDVKRILGDARSRPTPFPWPWMAGALALVSVAILGSLWARRFRRNRYRIAPAEVVRLLEDSPEPPIILDVRSANAYAASPLRIPNSVHVTPEELKGGTPAVKIDPDRTVVAYCT